MKKDLYGLKQAPRTWYGRIDSFLSNMGFTKSKVDPNLYLRVVEDEPVILLLYVDDLFLTGNEKQIIESKNVVSSKWIYKIRYVADRSKLRVWLEVSIRKRELILKRHLLQEARYMMK